MHSEVPKPRRLTTLGVAMTVLAVTGWLVTMVVSAFVAQPDTVEDLSAAWKQAGPIPLGETADVTVPGRQFERMLRPIQCQATGRAGPMNAGVR